MAREVFASAPTRVDYGGGTLDIYPLYVFFNGGITINAAINLDAPIELKPRADERIYMRSFGTSHELD